jgi:hypothetical protein
VPVFGDGVHWIWNLSSKLFGNTAERLEAVLWKGRAKT